MFGVLAVLAIDAFMLAWRKLQARAPPTPTMAIDEAKRIRETVASRDGDWIRILMADAHARPDPRLDRAEPP